MNYHRSIELGANDVEFTPESDFELEREHGVTPSTPCVGSAAGTGVGEITQGEGDEIATNV